MYRDFIVKQTSDFDSGFKAKTLVGNWYEERCNPSRPENFHFNKERRNDGEVKDPILTQVRKTLFSVKLPSLHFQLAQFPRNPSLWDVQDRVQVQKK